MAKKVKHQEEVEEEVEKGWSLVRITVALIFVAVFVGGVIWSFLYVTRFVLQSTQQVLGAQTDTPSHIRLPTEKDFKLLMSSAPEYVSTFIKQQEASDSSIMQFFEELQNLQATDKGIEDVVCKYLCKDILK